MSQETKRRSLLLLGGVLISLVLLAGSLSNLELHAGTPFPRIDSHYAPGQNTPQQVQVYSVTSLPSIVGLALLLVTIYVLMRLIEFVNLKRFLRWLFRFVLALTILFIVLVVLSHLNFGPTGASEWIPGIAPSPSEAIPTSPLGRPPLELIWFIAIGSVLVTGWIIIQIFMLKGRPSRVEDPLLQQAKNAMENLQAGRDFQNVIIDCYLQMMSALREEHGIERNSNMTTHEFQGWLELKGWPRLPVQQLTDLFERVRYGKQNSDEHDEETALHSLSEIIEFAERTKDEAFTE